MITFQEYLAAKSEYYYFENEKSANKPDWLSKLYYGVMGTMMGLELLKFGIGAETNLEYGYRKLTNQPTWIDRMHQKMQQAMDTFDEELIQQNNLDFFQNKYKMSEKDLISWMKSNPRRLLKVWHQKHLNKIDPNDEVANLIKSVNNLPD